MLVKVGDNVDVFLGKVMTRDERIVYPLKLSALKYSEETKEWSRDFSETVWYVAEDIERLIKELQFLAAKPTSRQPEIAS